MTPNPDPLTVPEDVCERCGRDQSVRVCEHCGHRWDPPPRLTVDAGWLLVVAIFAGVVGVIVGRLTG